MFAEVREAPVPEPELEVAIGCDVDRFALLAEVERCGRTDEDVFVVAADGNGQALLQAEHGIRLPVEIELDECRLLRRHVVQAQAGRRRVVGVHELRPVAVLRVDAVPVRGEIVDLRVDHAGGVLVGRHPEVSRLPDLRRLSRGLAVVHAGVIGEVEAVGVVGSRDRTRHRVLVHREGEPVADGRCDGRGGRAHDADGGKLRECPVCHVDAPDDVLSFRP
ncbi:hypothetical protein D3C83_07860 [compost metagenome]